MNDYPNQYDPYRRPAGGADQPLRPVAPPSPLDGVRNALRQGRIVPAIVAAVAALLTGGGLAAATRGDSSPSDQTTTGTATTVAASTSAPGAPGPVVATAPPPVATTAPSPPATPPPIAATTTTTTTAAPPPDPPDDGEDDDGGDVVVTPTPAQEPLLFMNFGYVGRWVGGEFVYSQPGNSGPDWLAGSTVELHNPFGETYTGTVTECAGSLRLVPPPPHSEGSDMYWFTGGAPLQISEASDDHGVEGMNAALAQMGLNPLRAGSYGVPLSADGSADRLVWYMGDGDLVWWLATYDIETGTFATIEGDPNVDPGFEIGVPSRVWHDLDDDGNLESSYFAGESRVIVEWATGERPWGSPSPSC